ncbi:MAG: hypothetical protein ACK4SL_04400 [Candidatus Paceibacteria bacterium]
MIDQARIQQIVKRLLKSPSVEERQAINPPREWALGIMLSLIGVGVGGAVSYLSYLNTVSVEVVAPVVVEPAAYSGVVVEGAAMQFRERAARFAELRGDTSVPVPAPIETVATTTKAEVPPPTEVEVVPEIPETPVDEAPASEPDGLTPELGV